MTFSLKNNQLKSILKNNHNDDFIENIVNLMSEILPSYQIDNCNRVAAFIAQCAHESNEFTITKENLNYSSQGLAATWPKKFAIDGGSLPNDLAISIQHNQQKIANIVYANRMGNADESSGDGYKFRGRGYIQITGRDNYNRIGSQIGIDLIISPELAEHPEVALKTACHFWLISGLNSAADKGDITRITKIINGGFNGIKDRQEYYDKAIKILS